MRDKIKRWIILGLGWTFIFLGILGLFLPILQGVLFLFVGLILLSRESRLIRRLLAYIRMRYPRFSAKIRQAELRANRLWFRVRNWNNKAKS